MTTQTIRLDVTPGGVPAKVKLSQYDHGTRTILAALFDGQTPFSIPSGATVSIMGTKADKTGFQYECEYTGNTVTIDVTEQMTMFEGEVLTELCVQDSTGEDRLGTANFILVIEPAALKGDILISKTDLPMVQEAAEASVAAKQAAASAAGSARDAAGSAGDAAASATAAAGSARNAASSAGDASDSATAAAGSANDAAGSARNAAGSAGDAADSATAAAGSANDAAGSAGNAAGSAGDAADSATAAAGSANDAAGSARDAAGSAGDAADSATAAAGSANDAAASESAAALSEGKAHDSEVAALASENAAGASATLAESWAVGGTDTRSGEDTNNSHYWSQRSQRSANDSANSAELARQYAAFVEPHFIIQNNRLYLRDDAVPEFIVAENRLCIKLAS